MERSEEERSSSAKPFGGRLALFSLWLAAVVAMSFDHVVWRDEMRAMSFALAGSDPLDMLRGLQGEGHPALWYLLLRAAHAVWQNPAVLKVVAVCVAAAAVLLLLRRSPFQTWMLALILLGRFTLFDYAVLARNYGISMLIMFGIAAVWPRGRERGVALGLLLALLANTNVGSSLIVAAFLLFWLIETLQVHDIRRMPAMRHFALNAGIAVVGVAACFATVYPPFNDAAVIGQAQVTPLRVLGALVRPAGVFAQAFIYGPWEALDLGPVTDIPDVGTVKGVVSALIFGSLLGLIRRPSALTAGLLALLANALLFTVVYPGQYRHEALWLVFLIVLYWIAGDRKSPSQPWMNRIAALGFASFVALLLLQVLGGVRAVVDVATAAAPFSRSRDLARLIEARPELHAAIVIADPDYVLESLPYYRANPTYLLREGRFGRTARFSNDTRRELSLTDIIDTARGVAARTGRPVIILLEVRLGLEMPAQRLREGYNWTLVTTPVQVRAFLAATTRLARFGPARSGETFDVYLLRLR